MTLRDALPPTLRRVHRHAGMRGVRALVGALAGRRFWVPVDGFPPQHQTHRAIAAHASDEVAAAVCDALTRAFAGSWYEVPLGAALERHDRDRDIRRRRASGEDLGSIARDLGITRRQARKIANRPACGAE